MPCFLQKQIPTKPTDKETRARGASRISAHSDAHLTNHSVWKHLFGFWIESSCSKSMTFLRQLRILAGEFLMWGLWRAVARTFWFDVFLLRRSQITQAGLKVNKTAKDNLELLTFLSPPPKGWDGRQVPPGPATLMFGFKISVSSCVPVTQNEMFIDEVTCHLRPIWKWSWKWE